MISRGQFTNYLHAQLAAFGLPLGDNDTPPVPHGWQGEPNATLTNFIPWIVIAPGTATRPEGALADSQTEWRMPYYFSACGISREQTESIADKIRVTTKALTKTNITMKDQTWRLVFVGIISIGSVSRIGATNPPYHLQTDTLEFWLSKEI